MDFADWSDAKLHEEIKAMELALGASQSTESEARLRQKLAAAQAELEKRDAKRS